VTGGTASTTPGPGLLPLADAQGKIDDGWMPEDIARTEAVLSAAAAAADAADTAAEAQSRVASFLLPSPEAPVVRDDGAPLQMGDRYFNSVEQAEFIYTSDGWEANDSLVAIDDLKTLITEEPTAKHIPKAGDDGVLSVGWMPNELVRAMNLASDDGADQVGYVFGAENSTPTSVKFKIAERVSAVDFMSPAQKIDFFAKTGLVDQTSALNAFWRYIKSTFVDVSSEDYVKSCGEIPSGVYRVDGSINFTNLKARNTILLAHGAVFHGRGSGKNVVDMTGTRWLQTYGLTVFGDELSKPRAALLLGPQNTDVSGINANGNNAFFGCNFTGHFETTAIWNIGSETTSWFRCRGANYNTDPDSKVFIGDGKMRLGAASDYGPLRDAGVGASCTNNQFYSCDFRHMGGGVPVWLEFTRGWGFDRGCYFISYNDSIFEIYQSSTSVNQNLSIEGLMETTFKNQPMPGNTGCKHQIKFVGDGTSSELEGFTFKIGIPHTALSSIKQDASSGALSLTNADIVIGHQLTEGVPIFDAPTLSITGRIQAAKANELNIASIASFNGVIVSSGAGSIRPKSGAYVEINASNGQIRLGGSGPRTYDGVYRAEGAAAEVAFKGRGKGAGGAELGNEVLTDALSVQAPTGSTNGIEVRASMAGSAPRIIPKGADPDIGLILNPKGNGKLIVPLVNIPAFSSDTAAAAGGVPVGGFYRIGNALQVRVL
jgi:hypothetical protein